MEESAARWTRTTLRFCGFLRTTPNISAELRRAGHRDEVGGSVLPGRGNCVFVSLPAELLDPPLQRLRLVRWHVRTP